ncbi:MAG: hypothetical protein VKO26_04885 [Cyanobacteriota bacterium]|nr:hypothetical protein [Cyanobacteriota bacterium]
MVTKRPSSAGAGAFEPPNPPDLSSDADQASGGEEFIPPDDNGSLDSDAADADVNIFLGSVDSQILTAKAELETLLGELAKEEDGPQSQAARDANVTGVGIGISDGTTAGALPGEPVLEVYTIESESAESLKARMASVSGVSALADKDFPLTSIRTGVIDALSHRFRLRPAPGGVSVGHVRITAGTLGVLCRGRTTPRNQRLMILSNNHVLANSNAAAIGDAIVQPGPYDGGKAPQDTIAILERFTSINFSGGNNLVDAATGWAWPDRVRKELVYTSGGRLVYFTVGSTPVGAVPGMLVGKTGRTTQLTSGRVTAIGVTVNVSYGGGRVARFVNQIAVRASSGDFSQGGDSGSLIWTWDSRRAPVGLLFAGGGGITFANRISDVLTSLSVNLVT